MPRMTVGVRLAAVTALLVVAVGTAMLAVSYLLLVRWLPDSIVLQGPAGQVAVPVSDVPVLASPATGESPDRRCAGTVRPVDDPSTATPAVGRALPAATAAVPSSAPAATPVAEPRTRSGTMRAVPVPTGAEQCLQPEGDLARALGVPDGAVAVLGPASQRTVTGRTTTASAQQTRQQVDVLLTQLVQEAARGYRSRVMERFAAQSAVMLTLLTIAAVAVGWAGSRRLLRPVHAVTATAQRLGAESLGERIEVSGPRDELRELAETFNAMLDRVEEAFGRERRFMANVSHELRTPLANQQVALELALEDPAASADELRRVAGTALDQNVRARRLIEELLLLARAEQGTADPAPGGCDLADAARHAVEAVGAVPDAVADLDLHADLAPAPVRGQQALVERLVGNLVENAVRHNHPGGFVRVSTRTLGGAGQVEVENSGPVVPAEAVDGLFEPFRRGTPGQGDRIRSDRGAGLGLSVVAAVAQRYGARLQAIARPEGGLRVTVTLPGPPTAAGVPPQLRPDGPHADR